MCFVVNVCKRFAKEQPKTFVAITHPYCVSLLLVGTVFFFLAEMFYVVPFIFDTGGGMYKLAWLVAIFIVSNILGNELVCYLTDTSVASLPEERRTPKPEEEHLWSYCDECKMKVPPRAWHCKLCKCCALRRDHHCIFTATCIGHNNYRYFFWLQFYLALGSVLFLVSYLLAVAVNKEFRNRYVLVWIIKNVWKRDYDIHVANWNEFLWQNWLLMLNTYAFTFSLLMLPYQLPIFYLNTTFYTGSDCRYNLGLRRNIKLLLGQRGLWTFISPWINSPLPHDGTRWEEAKPLGNINS
ncbi:probable palmitoyltransferase ZDHHC24 [Drosophila serrata]|uniref:probable palmitoyltransferase ZDHHC24 n=1 Tax=Drosophila serrata TaxID=7274 RepID=UPI000A1D2B21|nr:probable palmitoyltransferase ZDHHC24 [Drosophila serrata]